MLNFYPWGLSVNQVIPLSVDKTRIVYHGYVGNPEMLGKGAVSYTHLTLPTILRV